MKLFSLPSILWNGILSVVRWRDGLLYDGALAVVEAGVVLVFSQLALLAMSISYGLDTEGAGLVEAFKTVFVSTYRPTEMIIYVTGILSSTTAYIIARPRVLKQHGKRVMLMLLGAGALFWIATPLFVAGIDGAPANKGFAVNLAVGLGVAALVLWLYSLFSQRRLFERGVRVRGDTLGQMIANEIEES